VERSSRGRDQSDGRPKSGWEERGADKVTREEELEHAHQEAFSLGAHNEPDSVELLGIKEDSGNKFYFYKGSDGQYYYQSESSMKVEAEMREAMKKKKLRKLAVRRIEKTA
jgi:hypothetical protein